MLVLISILLSFLITVILSPIFIPFLKKLKFGQSIREEGPASHQKKSGTPTMGGIIIVFSIVVTTLLISKFYDILSIEIILLLFATLGFGLIGFLDDFIKIGMKRNLGLTSKQKLFGQIVVAVAFYFLLKLTDLSTAVTFPFTDYSLELGPFYALLVVFWLVGFSNAVNLTDGLDGLLSGTAVIAFGAFAVLAWHQGASDISLFSVAVVGALLGFLVFNAYPAKVFMGDTGSLALGGGIAAIAILTNLEILLIIIGGVFVIETLSVIIQVISFQTTGRRVFKMSPLHHHYELSGWSEWRVVVTFWVVGFLFAGLGIYIEVWI